MCYIEIAMATLTCNNKTNLHMMKSASLTCIFNSSFKTFINFLRWSPKRTQFNGGASAGDLLPSSGHARYCATKLNDTSTRGLNPRSILTESAPKQIKGF